MSWFGDRWFTRAAPVPRQTPSAPRRPLRNLVAAGIMVVVLAGLFTPTTDAGGRTSGRSLLADWSATSEVDVVNEASSRIGYRGTWRKVYHKDYFGDRAKSATRRGAKASLKFTGTAIVLGRTGRTHARQGTGVHRRRAMSRRSTPGRRPSSRPASCSSSAGTRPDRTGSRSSQPGRADTRRSRSMPSSSAAR